LKNNIGEEMKMFRKYQLAVWISIRNFYLHFTKVTRKGRVFWSHCRALTKLGANPRRIGDRLV